MKNSKVDLKDNQKLNTNLINTTANETNTQNNNLGEILKGLIK